MPCWPTRVPSMRWLLRLGGPARALSCFSAPTEVKREGLRFIHGHRKLTVPSGSARLLSARGSGVGSRELFPDASGLPVTEAVFHILEVKGRFQDS